MIGRVEYLFRFVIIFFSFDGIESCMLLVYLCLFGVSCDMGLHHCLCLASSSSSSSLSSSSSASLSLCLSSIFYLLTRSPFICLWLRFVIGCGLGWFNCFLGSVLSGAGQWLVRGSLSCLFENRWLDDRWLNDRWLNVLVVRCHNGW